MSADRDQWVERVLGVRIARQAQPKSAAAGLVNAARPLSNLARPSDKPDFAGTDRLLDAARRFSAPASDAALPQALMAFAPQMLTVMVQEPAMDASPLAKGASLPPQDQMLGLTDQIDTIGRMMQAWRSTIEQAESLHDQLVHAQQADPVPADLLDRVDIYNGMRGDAADLRDRTLAMLKSLRKASDALARTAQVKP